MAGGALTSVEAPVYGASGALHRLGVVCGLAAGVWLGAAEAPTKLVTAGFSPFAVSLWMVAGVFTARWTFPTLLKGTGYVVRDLRARKHLIVWALLAGALWAVANTLTVFAIRDVGLSIAFPLWNTNSLIGLLWGWLLFRELRGATAGHVTKVVLGAVCIVIAAILLGMASVHGSAGAGPHALRGLAAAVGASVLWGTMYVPYRKAYISGLNPLSFVTAFTVSELGTVLLLTWTLDGGLHSPAFRVHQNSGLLFWLFLGGFVWVIGDLFQQYAAKYLGIGRGIPLSNTNQLWGLAWGVLVFGELRGASHGQLAMVLTGSLLMVAGALAISTAVPSLMERSSQNEAVMRECDRYGLEFEIAKVHPAGTVRPEEDNGRSWWDWAIVAAAVGVFVWLGVHAKVPPLEMHLRWLAVLGVILLAAVIGAGWALWRQTAFE